MTLQKRKVNYRKIYEQHYGPIPIDSDGKSYDIHHIDGNHLNNDPSNLKAITINDHYDIHYQQGDYYACYLIMVQRMNKTKDEISKIATLNNLKRVENGTNPLVGGKLQRESNKKRWEEMGENHPAAIATRERVENGTHHLLSVGEDHPAYDDTIYCFENTKTGERASMTQNNFLRKYNLHSGSVSDLVNRKRNVRSVKHWVLVDTVTSTPMIWESPARDVKLYKFKNKIRGLVVEMTRKQMCDTFSLNRNALSEVITEKRKSVKGWILVKNNEVIEQQ